MDQSTSPQSLCCGPAHPSAPCHSLARARRHHHPCHRHRPPRLPPTPSPTTPSPTIALATAAGCLPIPSEPPEPTASPPPAARRHHHRPSSQPPSIHLPQAVRHRRPKCRPSSPHSWLPWPPPLHGPSTPPSQARCCPHGHHLLLAVVSCHSTPLPGEATVGHRSAIATPSLLPCPSSPSLPPSEMPPPSSPPLHGRRPKVRSHHQCPLPAATLSFKPIVAIISRPNLPWPPPISARHYSLLSPSSSMLHPSSPNEMPPDPIPPSSPSIRHGHHHQLPHRRLPSIPSPSSAHGRLPCLFPVASQPTSPLFLHQPPLSLCPSPLSSHHRSTIIGCPEPLLTALHPGSKPPRRPAPAAHASLPPAQCNRPLPCPHPLLMASFLPILLPHGRCPCIHPWLPPACCLFPSPFFLPITIISTSPPLPPHLTPTLPLAFLPLSITISLNSLS